jgi:hypothetical protein
LQPALGGGLVDFWSLDVTGRGGRGHGYHLVLVDEAAHDEGYLAGTLEAAIGPTTIDFRGKIVLASTPNGLDGAFWECATIAEKGYEVHHAPTTANPVLPIDEIAYLRSTLRPEVASQELDALFVDIRQYSTPRPITLLSQDALDGGGQPQSVGRKRNCGQDLTIIGLWQKWRNAKMAWQTETKAAAHRT